MWNWVAKLYELQQSGEAFAIVTVTHSRGSTPREGGAKMLVLADGKFFGTIGGGQLEKEALAAAVKSINEAASRTVAYPLCASVHQCCGGSVEVFIEVMNREPKVYLFGAGHVGQAVCRTLVGTPFKVYAIDERSEWITSNELPHETIKVSKPWRSFVGEAEWNEDNTYVVVMTHLHDLDYEIVDQVLKHPARYIGLVGSKAKWATFQKRFREAGVAAVSLSRVKCPLGIDVGGKAPQEVAISLAAELLATFYGKTK